MSQEQGLHATCETRIVYWSGWLPAELSVQSAWGIGAVQAVSQLLIESLGSFILHTSDAKHYLPGTVTGGHKIHDINSIGWISFRSFLYWPLFILHIAPLPLVGLHIRHQIYSSGETRLVTQEYDFLHKILQCNQRT